MSVLLTIIFLVIAVLAVVVFAVTDGETKKGNFVGGLALAIVACAVIGVVAVNSALEVTPLDPPTATQNK